MWQAQNFCTELHCTSLFTLQWATITLHYNYNYTTPHYIKQLKSNYPSSISAFALPSMHHSNSPLIVSYPCNFCHRLVRYYTLRSPLNTPQSSHSTCCTPPPSTLHSLQWYCNKGKNIQDCWNYLFHKSVLRDCIRIRCLLVLYFGDGIRSFSERKTTREFHSFLKQFNFWGVIIVPIHSRARPGTNLDDGGTHAPIVEAVSHPQGWRSCLAMSWEAGCVFVKAPTRWCPPQLWMDYNPLNYRYITYKP